jgi:hypothetical protein
VNISSVLNGQFIKYDAPSSKYINTTDVDANQVRTSGVPVAISSTAPTANQVLKAYNPTNASWTDFKLAGLSDVAVVATTEGRPLQYNAATSKFVDNYDGWKDLLGEVSTRTGGAGEAPVVTLFGTAPAGNYTGIYEHQCITGTGNGTNFYFTYHMPHDYQPGTDLFIHVHWAVNTTATGTQPIWYFSATYAKGFDQAAFASTPITNYVVGQTGALAYRHMITEMQLSTPGGSASMLDTNAIEVDGIISVGMRRIHNSTIGGFTDNLVNTNAPFVFSVDIHYKSNNGVTKNKAPPFYT